MTLTARSGVAEELPYVVTLQAVKHPGILDKVEEQKIS